MGFGDVKVIVFDLDGTLIDSNQLKYDAFFEIFKGKRERNDAVREVLREHREKSRFHIVRMVIERLGTEPGSCTEDMDRLVSSYAEAYNRIVEQGAANCPEKPGCSDTLKILHRHFRLFVNSSTPNDPLKRIIQARGLEGYFARVYGYPPGKLENLKMVSETSGAQPSEICFVGDGQSDLDAAKAIGCRFIGIRNQYGGLEGNDMLLLDDLIDLPARLLVG